MKFTREELRPLAILADLPDEHLDWFCEHGERVQLATGDRMFESGQIADALWIVVAGTIQGFEEVGGQWLLVATTRAGEVTGMLPFSRMTHYPRHTVAREYAPDLATVPANEGELNQVWTNLIDNAIDAVDDGGRLIVKARRNDIWVEVEIVDDGPGVPEEIQAQIFEPFFTTKGVGVGTGLGLGISMRIVKTHQGHIEFRSRPGETAMCVRLPISPTAPGH